MANNQMPLPGREDDIIQQSEAYSMAGITRAVLRGCLDRGELRIADHLGSRGSARVYRSDVARLMAEKKWPGTAGARPIPEQGDGTACRDCAALRAEIRSLKEARARDADKMQRLRDAFDAAIR
jgi:hypothetical protein